jgi:hypothetical protein
MLLAAHDFRNYWLAGYEMRCYWFEVFECLRKIALVGLPVALPMGSAAQLILGLLICFISAGAYAKFAPYADVGDDRLAQVCQLSLFFSLIAAIALKMEYDTSAPALGIILKVLLAVPPVLAFLFQSGIDFRKDAHISAASAAVGHCCHTIVGKFVIRHFAEPPSEVHPARQDQLLKRDLQDKQAQPTALARAKMANDAARGKAAKEPTDGGGPSTSPPRRRSTVRHNGLIVLNGDGSDLMARKM